MTYLKALTEVASAAGVAYAYSLTVWATGALAAARFGLPGGGEVALFVLGGSAAYIGVALAVSHRKLVRPARPPAVLWENACAVPAIGVAWVAIVLARMSWLAWLVAPAVATLAYILGLALFVKIVVAHDHGDASSQRPRTRRRARHRLDPATSDLTGSEHPNGRRGRGVDTGRAQRRGRSTAPHDTATGPT